MKQVLIALALGSLAAIAAVSSAAPSPTPSVPASSAAPAAGPTNLCQGDICCPRGTHACGDHCVLNGAVCD